MTAVVIQNSAFNYSVVEWSIAMYVCVKLPFAYKNRKRGCILLLIACIGTCSLFQHRGKVRLMSMNILFSASFILFIVYGTANHFECCAFDGIVWVTGRASSLQLETVWPTASGSCLGSWLNGHGHGQM